MAWTRRSWTRWGHRFQVTFRGRDVYKCPTLSSGIQFGNFELDYALAAQWWGFRSLEEFRGLDNDIQAHNVAVYRTQKQIEAVLAYDQHKKAKERQRGTKTGRNAPSRRGR